MSLRMRCRLGRWQVPKEVVATRHSTMQEQSPLALQITQATKAVEKDLFILQSLTRVVVNKVRASERSPQDFDSSLCGCRVFSSDPDVATQLLHSWRSLPATVPHLALAKVTMHARIVT